jgi:hypothetical protein
MTTTDRQRLLSFLGPNWFASVMGTGIVATAGATLPRNPADKTWGGVVRLSQA